jgi:DNA-binding NtrC family response regulator
VAEDSTHLLLVEDQAPLRRLLAEQLADRGYQVQQAENGEEALARLADFAFDLLITDLRLPGIDGTAVVDAAITRYPDIVAIVITGFGTVKDAVAAIKRGASDFVTKPFQIDELMRTVETAREQRRLKSDDASSRRPFDKRAGIDALVGRSPAMTQVFQMIETVAAASSTVLIVGETGTGKEVVARAIHQRGPRRANRFVVLNCSAIPESLQEAELFGHVRGAFTGAIANRPGRLEQAHRGTLFLDEIGTMGSALQMKLLRVLQEREFERLGDSHTIKVDVRVVAATNADLSQMVADGRFRQDLYYRLNVIPISLPPLRQRREDIPLLVQHFLGKYARTDADAEASPAVSQDGMRRLMAYHWPGNVRQLENTLERAAALGGGGSEIGVGVIVSEMESAGGPALTAPIALPEDGIDLDALVAQVESELIHRSLERTGGNKGQAARLLGLKRTTLVEKLKRLNRTASDN